MFLEVSLVPVRPWPTITWSIEDLQGFKMSEVTQIQGLDEAYVVIRQIPAKKEEKNNQDF